MVRTDMRDWVVSRESVRGSVKLDFGDVGDQLD